MYLKEGGWLDTLQSAALFWTEEEKREYLDSVPSGLCPECGSPVYQNPRGRHKKFCSDTCRYAWKKNIRTRLTGNQRGQPYARFVERNSGQAVNTKRSVNTVATPVPIGAGPRRGENKNDTGNVGKQICGQG